MHFKPEEDNQVLYEKDLLGSSTAAAISNTVWFNSVIHFGLLGCKEQREMCWGDVKLCQTSTGQESLEFNKRETKTRSGNDPRNARAIRHRKCLLCQIKRNVEYKPTKSTQDTKTFKVSLATLPSHRNNS